MDTREIIRSRAGELGQSTFVAPDIPVKKLRRAIRRIAGGGLQEETVVAVVDTSDTEDFASGLLFAEDAFYFTTSWGEPVRIPYGEIERAEALGFRSGFLSQLDIFGKPGENQRRFLVKFKGPILQIVDTTLLCRIYAKRFVPGVAAAILNTIVAATQEETRDHEPAESSAMPGAAELRVGYERAWARVDRASELCTRVGIGLCCTLLGVFQGIMALRAGRKLREKRKIDADLPERGLPLEFYEADVEEMLAPLWWNVYAAGPGVSDMCWKSRRRLDAMAAVLRDLKALPQETILYLYEKKFRTCEIPQENLTKQVFRSVHRFCLGVLVWFLDNLCIPLVSFFGKSARKLNVYRLFWGFSAREDGLSRKFVRVWLEHLEAKGEITVADLDGRKVVFAPDRFREAKGRMELLLQSAERVPRATMVEGLKKYFPTDDRNVDAFVRLHGTGTKRYTFADGIYYVAGQNQSRVRVCPSCGLAAMKGDGSEGGDGFCCDYCRETAEICKRLDADGRTGALQVADGAIQRLGAGQLLPGVVLGNHGGGVGKRIEMVGKGVGKYAGGKVGALVGGSLLACIPGGWLLGSLAGRFLGRKLGNQAVAAGMGVLAEDGGEDVSGRVMALVQDEFGIQAAMYGLNDDEIDQVVSKLSRLMTGNTHFVEDVHSQQERARPYLARWMKPLFIEIVLARGREARL